MSAASTGAIRSARPSFRARPASGIPLNPDYNGPAQAGVGTFQRAIRRGRRVSTARAFLLPAAAEGGIDIRTDAQAAAILFDGKRAIGVRYRQNGTERTVLARREVILSSGAINSPALLQRSGIGPAPLLSGLGIPAIHDLPGVGENLRDHYAVRMVARAKGLTINNYARPPRLWAEIAKWAVGRPSILALSPSLIHVFWKSDPALDAPDLQFTFTPASYKAGGIAGMLDSFPGHDLRRVGSSGRKAWAMSASAQPIRSIIPKSSPIIWRTKPTGGFCWRESDWRGGLMTTPELKPFYDHEELPGAEAQTDDELMHWARQQGSTVSPPDRRLPDGAGKRPDRGSSTISCGYGESRGCGSRTRRSCRRCRRPIPTPRR